MNKIPVRAHHGHGPRVAGLSSRSRSKRAVEGRARRLLVAALIGVSEGLAALYLVNRHGVTVGAMKLSSCPLRRSSMSSLQHQHFRLKRRQCSRLRATGEEFIGGPEKAEQSIEWNPKSYGLPPLDHFIRCHEAKHIYQEEVKH